jgi:beta-glucosidase/6-phospho-beta-glucosidase/beta-galactosidase
LKTTGHEAHVARDYELLLSVGIRTVREGIRWGFVERAPYDYNFEEVRQRIRAGLQAGIVQCWDLCHFGYPDDLMPTHPLFASRFAALCQAFVQVFRQEAPDAPLIITPINEISFLAWHSGDMRGTVPFAINSGWDIKYHLCKAAIAGVRAIRAIDRTARIMHVEPLIHIHAVPGLGQEEIVEKLNEDQFQAMDIISGKICPELMGSPDYLDIVGVNYYFANQWEHGGQAIPWAPGDDPRLIPLVDLLEKVEQRYGRPLVISETGHFNDHRSQWLGMVMEQCHMALDRGIDLQGMCIYPIIDRTDWDRLDEYIHCGVWAYTDSSHQRTPHEESIAVISACSLQEKHLSLRQYHTLTPCI